MHCYFLLALLLFSTVANAQIFQVDSSWPKECKDTASEYACKHIKNTNSCNDPIAGGRWHCRKTCNFCT
ncbi:hypothetical protein ANCCAN_04224 [Ancylostoma caninum]|uniref:ShKT domain-containing protein n=1 Tax=Ancylostoma caninum TaxID=29170 RepID=A0A368H3D6_ANCCA|nr:hypothetical protein ANCCAN_04224 [Ancylostoma caninum]